MPERNLKVALLPLNIINGEPDANIRLAFDMLRSVDPDTDLAILPEMFTTSFFADASKMSQAVENTPEDLFVRLKELSDRLDMGICGSVAVIEDGKLYNRGFFVLPGKELVTYDKYHLFSAGGESRIMTGGSGISPIVDFRTWKLRMAICYDIRFPVWLRNKNLAYDALIVPANWPEAREFAWRTLLTARAIENQSYILGCNRTGEDAYGRYPMESSIVLDHWGKTISKAGDSGIIYAVLDADRINHDRARFRPWADADDFKLSSI